MSRDCAGEEIPLVTAETRPHMRAGRCSLVAKKNRAFHGAGGTEFEEPVLKLVAVFWLFSEYLLLTVTRLDVSLPYVLSLGRRVHGKRGIRTTDAVKRRHVHPPYRLRSLKIPEKTEQRTMCPVRITSV